MTTILEEIPRVLPVKHLSASSMNLLLQCPLKWKYRYIDAIYEPPSGAIVIGSAVHRAEGSSFQQQVDKAERLTTDDVLDVYSDEFDDLAERDVDWRDDKPGDLKDAGTKVLKVYHEGVASRVEPAAVERQLRFEFPDTEWHFTGYIDVETIHGGLVDLKVKAKAMSQADVLADIQPTAYLTARRAEGQPATSFEYHVAKKLLKPTVDVVTVERSDAQLDNFLVRLAAVAREIAWRTEHDQWIGAAPGAWWCSSKFCSHWGYCAFGGGS